MIPLKISVDLDDTLADFMGVATRILGPGSVSGVHSLKAMYPGREAEVQALLEDADLYRSLPVILGAQEALREMVSRFGCELAYVTARPIGLSVVTAAWLERNGFPPGFVFCVGRTNGSKAERIKKLEVKIAIDDYPPALDEITLLTEAKAVVFSRPWNLEYKDLPRIEAWDRATEVLESLIEEQEDDLPNL